MADLDLDAIEVHHEDCYVRSMRHMFKEPECNCAIAEVRRLRAERDRLKREAAQWYADKRLAWAKRDRLRDGIRKHRDDHRQAISRETQTRAEMNYRKRDANEALWALLDDTEEVRRD